jgi:hypothetical protein
MLIYYLRKENKSMDSCIQIVEMQKGKFYWVLGNSNVSIENTT